MQQKLKQLNQRLYLTIIIVLVAFLVLYWFINHSFVSIKVSPASARVLIDNDPVSVSRTGRARKTVGNGMHNIKIEADGYIGFNQAITLKRAQRKSFDISLKELPKPTNIAEGGTFLTQGKDFNTIYYLGDSGQRLYKVKIGLNDKGETEIKNQAAITDKKLSGITEIIWSPDFDLALFRKKDGIYLFDLHKYDFLNQTETKWGTDIGSIAWSPDNSKIAYYYAPKSGERSLIFANIANNEVTRVANLTELSIENPIVRWSPDSEWLAIIPRNTSSYDLNKIYLFNAYSREMKELTQTGSQIDASFSPDSNKILYGTYSKNPLNPVSSLLSIANKDGSEAKSLDLRAEVRKVAWKKDGKNIIVATYNEDKQQESIFGFNSETKEKTGFSITNLDTGYINSIEISNDEKIVIYETTEGIFALKVE